MSWKLSRYHFRFALTFLGAAALAIATVRNALSHFAAPAPDNHNRIVPPLSVGSAWSELFAPSMAGEWEDLPVAAFQQHLGADDIVYRQFTGKIDFQIYAAVWRAGNPNVGEAAAHLPEACWGLSGWRCIAARSGVAFGSGPVLKPGEWRRFVGADGHLQEALFWCVVGESILPRPYRGGTVARGEFHGVLELFQQSDFLGYWWARCSAPRQPGTSLAIPVPCPTDVMFIRINAGRPLQAVLEPELLRQLQPAFAAVGLLQ